MTAVYAESDHVDSRGKDIVTTLLEETIRAVHAATLAVAGHPRSTGGAEAVTALVHQIDRFLQSPEIAEARRLNRNDRAELFGTRVELIQDLFRGLRDTTTEGLLEPERPQWVDALMRAIDELVQAFGDLDVEINPWTSPPEVVVLPAPERDDPEAQATPLRDSAMPYATTGSVIDLVTRFVSLISDEVKVAAMLYHAVFAFSKIEPLLQSARQQLRQHGESDADIVRLIDASRTLGQWARELVDDDYQALTVHSLVGLWAIVEVTVEDTATFILVNHPDALADLEKAGVRLSGRLSMPLNEPDARRVYQQLERHSRKDRNVAEGYRDLLSVLGIHVAVTSDTTVTLAELNYVRNCFLHRGGIVDERAAQEAPRLGVPLGAKIRVTDDKSKAYLKAASDFAGALLKGAFESRYSPIVSS